MSFELEHVWGAGFTADDRDRERLRGQQRIEGSGGDSFAVSARTVSAHEQAVHHRQSASATLRNGGQQPVDDISGNVHDRLLRELWEMREQRGADNGVYQMMLVAGAVVAFILIRQMGRMNTEMREMRHMISLYAVQSGGSPVTMPSSASSSLF